MKINIIHMKPRLDAYYPRLPENATYQLEWADYELFPRMAPMKMYMYKAQHNSTIGMFRELQYQLSKRTRHGKTKWVVTHEYTSPSVFKSRKTFNTPEEVLTFATMMEGID